jgi:hypothetical protein
MNLSSIFNKQPFSGFLSNLFYLSLPCLLATWLYAPVFFYGQTQIHGDSIIHNLPVIEFNRKMLHEGISPLWTNLLFGGHPYFAEGQGGFLNPLNFIVALFFHPVIGQHVYNWLSMIIGAWGLFLLCRHFKHSLEASSFGALAAVFSHYWIQNHVNITISGSLCWVPWAFLCFERWLDRPTGKSALFLALAVSLLIFAGYPQVFHGAIIYMAVSLLPTLFAGHIGSRADNSFKQYALTGLAAIALCIGLSAIQWMPLLELTLWSHRSAGIGLPFKLPLNSYLRGFLFADYKSLWHFETLSSLMVCFIASLSLFIKPNHRTLGHIIAIIFLVIIGLEYATPIFQYLLYFQIVPGLKYFRIVHIYLGVGIIGLGLLSSIAIDHIQRQSGKLENRKKDQFKLFSCGSVLFLAWAGLGWHLRPVEAPIMSCAIFITAYLMFIMFTFINKSLWFGHAALLLLVVEIITIQMSSFPFFDSKILEKPQLVQHIQADVRNSNYKIMNTSGSWTVGLRSPWDPKLEVEIRKAFQRVSPSTNALWNIPSIDGLLALPLARHQMIQSKMKAEIEGKDYAPPGARLIDYLGIRYISAEDIYQSEGLAPLTMDGIIVLENKYACPSIQIFTRYEMANSAADALNLIKQSKVPTLILEPPIHQAPNAKSLTASTEINDPHALTIRSSQLSNNQYHFTVDAIRPAWLFIADANYPGWQAKIDGHVTPVYSAQVLGKAVFVPEGRHQITVEFKPLSVALGFYLLILTLLVLSFISIRSFYLKKQSQIP